MVDEEFPGAVLLAEANQWPSDVVEYFGSEQEPEFHMAFHFPLMPRMFMAMRREQRTPIVEIMESTPEIRADNQWAIFLRNHDELTLEMVTDEERDYMYFEYAKDPRMRINVGIRRRLAPLLDNGRRQIEMMNSLLLSMPGTPVLYYGDEIGMGDNVFLGDRNGVRTPMQWSGDRNAGFSRADWERLYSPVIMDPVYGYQSVNVDAQNRLPTSLLNWMKRLIAVRKRYHAFGRGTIRFLHPENTKVLAYLREYEGEVLFCVVNLSRFAQFAEVDLSEFDGHYPVELMGETRFPDIGTLPYLLTMGPHAFFWFRIEQPTS
jgi:maltose alpha-D-glucosyltransferase/alpha-amylase